MNVLLINADQLRHDSVGYRGLRNVHTPNIDRLASQSVVYENAFTPLPVCSPARQSILCGRRPDYFGAQWNYDFLPTPELDPDLAGLIKQLREKLYQLLMQAQDRFAMSPWLKRQLLEEGVKHVR